MSMLIPHRSSVDRDNEANQLTSFLVAIVSVPTNKVPATKGVI